MAHGHQESAFV